MKMPPYDHDTCGPATCKKEPCKCWTETNAKLEKHGLQLSNKLLVITVAGLDFKGHHSLPLESLNGKLKKSQPSTIPMNYCPFCGQKY